MDNKKVAQELRNLAERLGIDLSLANTEKTREILKGLKVSLSDDIIKVREGDE